MVIDTSARNASNAKKRSSILATERHCTGAESNGFKARSPLAELAWTRASVASMNGCTDIERTRIQSGVGVSPTMGVPT